jgi:hypothetical protein
MYQHHWIVTQYKTRLKKLILYNNISIANVEHKVLCRTVYHCYHGNCK